MRRGARPTIRKDGHAPELQVERDGGWPRARLEVGDGLEQQRLRSDVGEAAEGTRVGPPRHARPLVDDATYLGHGKQQLRESRLCITPITQRMRNPEGNKPCQEILYLQPVNSADVGGDSVAVR